MRGFALPGLLVLIATPALYAQQSASTQDVAALGRLEPENGIIAVSSSSMPEAILGATLLELHVKEGQDVTRGQLLGVIDTQPELQTSVHEAEAELDYRKREVSAAQSASEEACVRAKVAAQEAERRTRLHEQGVAGEEEAESAHGEAEARSAACETSRATVQLAESGVAVGEARLAHARARLDRAHIRAPQDGRVLHILRRPGELLGEHGLLEMGAVERMYAIAEVYETDIRQVKTGQRATISSPALVEDLSGTVRRIRQMVAKQDEIGTDPAARKDARIVEVFIELEDSRPAQSLTNLQVDIIIHR
jgi:HlyD family secretion protein